MSEVANASDDAHADEAIIREDGHELIQLLRLQADAPGEVIVLQTGA